MTEYVLVHHLIMGVLLVLWVCLAYLNVSSPAGAKILRIAPRRVDFLDPDFGVKASLNLASRQRSKCRVGAAADSEIPELGLDSGRLSVDCDVNPRRVAKVVYGAAKRYGDYRRKHRYQPQSTRVVKQKRTRIQIDRDQEKVKTTTKDDEDDD